MKLTQFNYMDKANTQTGVDELLCKKLEHLPMLFLYSSINFRSRKKSKFGPV